MKIICISYEPPCSPNCSCDHSDIPSSPSCSKERHSSSPSHLSKTDRDREASTSPTTSAIKTVQSILATLQAGQMSLNQLLALQSSPSPSLIPPWSLPLTSLASLTSPLTSAPDSSTGGSMQQMYLQQQQQVLQQTLHNLMPGYPPFHSTGQTHTMLLQNQVQSIRDTQIIDKISMEISFRFTRL